MLTNLRIIELHASTPHLLSSDLTTVLVGGQEAYFMVAATSEDGRFEKRMHVYFRDTIRKDAKEFEDPALILKAAEQVIDDMHDDMIRWLLESSVYYIVDQRAHSSRSSLLRGQDAEVDSKIPWNGQNAWLGKFDVKRVTLPDGRVVMAAPPKQK